MKLKLKYNSTIIIIIVKSKSLADTSFFFFSYLYFCLTNYFFNKNNDLTFYMILYGFLSLILLKFVTWINTVFGITASLMRFLTLFSTQLTNTPYSLLASPGIGRLDQKRRTREKTLTFSLLHHHHRRQARSLLQVCISLSIPVLVSLTMK